MNSPIKFIYCLFSLLILPSLTINSQDNPDKRLHIKGKVLNNDGRVNNVQIRIVHDNGVVDTVLAKKGKYNLHLELNHKILLEFECLDTDHYTKRIAFNTNVPKSVKKIPYFDLTMNLVDNSLFKIKEQDKDLMDLPVGYLNYNSRKGIWFDRNAKYSRVINKKMKGYGIY